jgi:pyruvate formate lyase activating enzyme
MEGQYHSIESFGTVDGPGIRFVLFLQGCPMRCLYCHNPDTWSFFQGRPITVAAVVEQVLKYQAYLKNGGVTVSGGEPLRQIPFLIELFTELKKYQIHTAIDTSGILFDENNVSLFDDLMRVTDLVLLDIKAYTESAHLKLTGQSNKRILAFAKYLSQRDVPVWIRYVLVPGVTDSHLEMLAVRQFIETLRNVKKIEVLPYHSMGEKKYEALGLHYALSGVKEPDEKLIADAERILVYGKR